ncbi:MAG: LLM class flavin-dependent oxidoreductase, partial [Acidimicrobiia bacterium]|nr:LLM class flavin-dependent oxidoreductase [Acidimicrobiia bacterium]
AGEVADGVHLHPIADRGYIERHAIPTIAEGARRAGRDPAGVDMIKPLMTIVGDTDEEIADGRDRARASVAFYASTPNYAFVLDEAGFEGTTSRIREKQKAGELAAMTAEITDEHLATFCVESSWDGLAAALIDEYGATASRLVLYNAGSDTPDRFDRYGDVARTVSNRTSS